MLNLIDQAIANNGLVVISCTAAEIELHESVDELVRFQFVNNPLLDLAADKLINDQQPLAKYSEGDYSYSFSLAPFLFIPGINLVDELKTIRSFFERVSEYMERHPSSDLYLTYANINESDEDDEPLPMKPEIQLRARNAINYKAILSMILRSKMAPGS